MKALDRLPDVFTPEEAMKEGFTPYALAKLVGGGSVEKVTRGIYKKSEAEDLGEWTGFLLASKKVHQKNVICLASALVYHKLAEVIPPTVWLLVDFNIRSNKPGISLLRRRDPSWNRGIIKDGSILVTDMERTLVESLVFKDKVGYNEAYYALKKALNKKKPLTTATKVIERAKELGFDHLIQKAMEPFIYA